MSNNPRDGSGPKVWSVIATKRPRSSDGKSACPVSRRLEFESPLGLVVASSALKGDGNAEDTADHGKV